MGITEIIFFAILACSAVLSYWIMLIEKDIEELNELIKKNKGI